METNARVLTVRDGRARIACDDRAACGACGRGGRCALKWFSGGSGATLEVPAWTSDHVLLRPGQAVTITVGDGEVLRAAATVYLPPLTGLLLGAASGSALGVVGVAGEAGTLLMATVGALVGWGFARTWSRNRPPSVSVMPIDGEAP
jgi:sigma-E factor negative regulatory protein RseC